MTPSHRSATERITIRDAQQGDLSHIVAIERAAFSDPWSLQSFGELLGRDTVVFLVAVTDVSGVERVAGYGVAYHAGGEAELANVAVDATYRNQGIGAMLVQGVLDGVRRAGALDCWLEVRASNEGARRLYRHLAFDDVGLRKRYYARPVEDAVVMRRDLRRS